MAQKSKMRGCHGRIRRGSKMAMVGRGILKPCAGGDVKSLGRENRRRGCASGLGNVVKASDADSKPNNVDSVEQAWIDVGGHRIEKGSLRIRINSEGDVYVPDSEDEKSGMEVEACGLDVAASREVAMTPKGQGALEVAMEGASSLDLGPWEASDRAAGMELAPAVAMNGAANGPADKNISPEVAARVAKKVLGDDLHPEVAARLAEVLSKMEPLYHECFISMYKVMVPLFFVPAP